jgi:hypothetical protein
MGPHFVSCIHRQGCPKVSVAGVTISVMTPAVAVKALQRVRRGYILHPIFVWFAPHSQVETRKHSKSELDLMLVIDPQLNVLLSFLVGACTKSHNINQDTINSKHNVFPD